VQVDHFGLCDQHGADDNKLGAGAQAQSVLNYPVRLFFFDTD